MCLVDSVATLEVSSGPHGDTLRGLYPTRQTPASYEFRYGIKDDLSDNDYGHLENREGDFTQGSYHVQLPDGRLQKVTYSVKGDSGFVVQVTYEGEAGPPAAV
ncbi:pro-resilin-like [Procambarus clarkii]|uniref:pro-resilin-like n=1 Tax=Procambarus clarkii TaxID=6728 RepID=UPI003742D80D